MTDHLQGIARGFVKSRHWRWSEGMVLCWGIDHSMRYRLSSEPLWDVHLLCGGIPDLDDQLTRRKILQLVREARGEPEWRPVALYHDPTPDWVIEPPSSKRQTLYSSYVSALYAALPR